jgi:hypothetical protein
MPVSRATFSSVIASSPSRLAILIAASQILSLVTAVIALGQKTSWFFLLYRADCSRLTAIHLGKLLFVA